jgi:hypothetical protein
MRISRNYVDRYLHRTVAGLRECDHVVAFEAGFMDRLLVGDSTVALLPSRRLGRFHLPVRSSGCVAAYTTTQFVCAGRGKAIVQECSSLAFAVLMSDNRRMAFGFVGPDVPIMVIFEGTSAKSLERFGQDLEAQRDVTRSAYAKMRASISKHENAYSSLTCTRRRDDVGSTGRSVIRAGMR